jgi:hypothetical protein
MIPEIIKMQYFLAVKNLNVQIITNHTLWYKHIMNLSQKQQAVYTILLFDNHIKTEGFTGYFTSSFGMFAQETLDNLHKIGGYKHASILQRVLDSLKVEPINDISQFDAEYKAIEDESIVDLLLKFIQIL